MQKKRINQILQYTILILFLLVTSMTLISAYGPPEEIRGPPTNIQMGPPPGVEDMGPPTNIPTKPPTEITTTKQPQQEITKPQEPERVGPGGCQKPSECIEYCNNNPQDLECAEKIKNKGSPEKHKTPPTQCPPKIKEADACKEFTQVMCTGMKYSMQKEITRKISATADYFDKISKENNIELDTTQLRQISNEVEPKIEAVCSSDENTFKQAMDNLFDTFSQEKMNTAFTTPIHGIQKHFSRAMDAKYAELQSFKDQLNALSKTQGGLEAGNIEAQANELIFKLTTAGKEITAVGTQMENLINGADNYAQNAAKYDPEIKKEYLARQQALTEKMTKFHDKGLTKAIEKFEKLGFDITAMKEVDVEIKTAQQQGQECAKNINPENEDPATCFDIMETKTPEWEAKIENAIKPQIQEKYLKQLNIIIPKVENAITLAKQKNIDATQIEITLNKLKTIKTKAETINKDQQDQAFTTLDDLKTTFAELKINWNELSTKLK